MKIDKLWEGYKFPSCEKCKKDCAGHLDYDNLCSNLNYLKEYAEKNFEKNKESFIELLQNSRITIESKGSIQTTYDVVESNKNQKGEGE